MAYSLSLFGPELYFAEGEPYDRPDYAKNAKGQPVSLWSAICMKLEESPEWRADLEGLLEVPESMAGKLPVDLLATQAIELAQEANTCSSLSCPVEVWIDRDGDLRVLVWDDRP